MIKVKPLEWKPYRGGDAEAVALGTIYTAFVSGYWRTQKDPKFKKGGEDLEAAKAAAQAHHDALILSMVEIPSPQTNVEALCDELLSAACLFETLSEDLPDDDISGVMMRVMAQRNRKVLDGEAPAEPQTMGEWTDDDRARAWRESFDAMHQRAMKAEAQVSFTLSDASRLLRKQDVEGTCPHPDHCFHFGEHARCGPCAVKASAGLGVEIDDTHSHLPEVYRLRREVKVAQARIAELEAIAPSVQSRERGLT